VFSYVNQTPMKKYRKHCFSVLSCLIIIFLGYPDLSGSEAMAGESKASEAVVCKVEQHLKDKKAKLGGRNLRAVAQTVCRESQVRKVDYRLVLAVMEVESNYRHDVISPDGSKGLMQLKPSTARAIAQEADISYNGSSDLFDPRKNIQIGVYFLSKLLNEFKSMRKALYAYNVGPYRAKKRIARLPINNKEPHSHFTRRVMLAFQNNMSTFPAF